MFAYDSPFPSRRSPVFARALVATSQPLAAQAGLRMLQRGGSAVDAALAAAIALVVVEPTGNGLGSDNFALLWSEGELHGLNASGASPVAWTPGYFAGQTAMPVSGADSITVPGAVGGWRALWEKFGVLDWPDLFEPAIEIARRGFGVSPVIAREWITAFERFGARPDWAAAFAPQGRAPHAGELFRCEAMARTLETIAHDKGESFYRGELAARIASHIQSEGGALTADDLAENAPTWVTPLAQNFAGYTLHELPPNGQGLVAQLLLGALDQTPFREADEATALHLAIECAKAAVADGREHIADPEAMQTTPAQLLASERLAMRAAQIGASQNATPMRELAGSPARDLDTVLITAADQNGQMVTLIQSNYRGFGSGLVVPDTGISLGSRGTGFSLMPEHPNRVAPRKRPFHTIIPGFLTRDGAPVAALGVMGGPMQPQGHAQLLLRTLIENHDPQAAIDAPRWFVDDDGTVALERGWPDEIAENLRARGHVVTTDAPTGTFGGAQMVWKLDDGIYVGASESRKDGAAVGF